MNNYNKRKDVNEKKIEMDYISYMPGGRGKEIRTT